MKLEGLSTYRILWLIGIALSVGAVFSFLQPGNWLIGWAAFSIILFIAFCLFVLTWRRASGGLDTSGKNTRSTRPPVLAWMMVLAFSLRLIAGVGLYLALPVDGYDDADDRAGYVFTDAHRRDE